jgi:hypothetical protein
MSKKNIYEVLNEFRLASTKAERIDVLKKNDSFALRSVLQGNFDPKIVFDVEKIPEYKHDVDVGPGLGYASMTEELGRIYLFVKDHPRRPSALTEKRRTEILIQILEALEKDEAKVFASMLMKDLKVPYLTEALINEAFPTLLS